MHLCLPLSNHYLPKLRRHCVQRIELRVHVSGGQRTNFHVCEGDLAQLRQLKSVFVKTNGGPHPLPNVKGRLR